MTPPHPIAPRAPRPTAEAAGPAVSVVTIFLDAERFLTEAVESVLAQTYTDWELLLVDDGSTDRSGEIARAYAAAYPRRIRYLTHPDGENRGTGASRNLGLAHARGRHVAFLDADDVYLPQKLERQVALLEAHPEVGMVYGATEYWYDWDADANRTNWVWSRFGVPTRKVILPPELLFHFLRDGGTLPCMGGLMVRTSVARAVGGFEERFRGLFEDQAFLAKIALAVPIYVTPDYHDRYRQHAESLCHRTSPEETHAARLDYLSWLRGHIESEGAAHPALDGALRAAERAAHANPTLMKLQRKARRATQRVIRRLVRSAPARLARSWRRGEGIVPPPGWVRFGSLRRVTPVSDRFGYDRGQPVDRYYIENFLERHRADVRGRVLEIGDATYTRRFGGDRVQRCDVLHVEEGNPNATIVADLASADDIPSDSFDCIICVQTLHLIYDASAAVRTLHRILKPGGVLLLTAPGISQIDRGEWGSTWFWSFTTASLGRLMGDVFPVEGVAIEAHGNVLAASAFLYGLASRELREEELNHADPCYQVVIAVRAVKP